MVLEDFFRLPRTTPDGGRWFRSRTKGRRVEVAFAIGGKGLRTTVGMNVRGRICRVCKRTGLTLLEVTIAIAITATVLMASGAAFGTNVKTVVSAQRTSRAMVFFGTVMEDLSAQPYTALLAFNGNRIYDGASAAKSNYAIDLSIFLASVDLLQVRALLTDLRTNRELARATTLRTRR